MGAVTTRVSSFGRINTTFYSLLKFLEERDGHNLEICDFGCLDGLHTIPFLKKGHIVDGFDMNDVYLYDGHIHLPIVKENGQIILQRRTIYGAEDRINIENLFNKARLYNKNIFDCCDRKKDLYPNEYEYNPFTPSKVDFLVSNDIKAGRSAIHYGNEFLSYSSISADKLRSVDIRLLKMIELMSTGASVDNCSVTDIVEKYNYLKEVALAILHSQLDIPLRETSYHDNSLIDIEKLSSGPKLVLK